MKPLRLCFCTQGSMGRGGQGWSPEGRVVVTPVGTRHRGGDWRWGSGHQAQLGRQEWQQQRRQQQGSQAEGLDLVCCPAQLHLHRVVVTDVEGLGVGHNVSVRAQGLPCNPVPASHLYLLLSEPVDPGEVEGGCSVQQALTAFPVQHYSVIGTVGAGPHCGVLPIGNHPVEACLSPQLQLTQALFGQRSAVSIEVPKQDHVLERGPAVGTDQPAMRSPSLLCNLPSPTLLCQCWETFRNTSYRAFSSFSTAFGVVCRGTNTNLGSTAHPQGGRAPTYSLPFSTQPPPGDQAPSRDSQTPQLPHSRTTLLLPLLGKVNWATKGSRAKRSSLSWNT